MKIEKYNKQHKILKEATELEIEINGKVGVHTVKGLYDIDGKSFITTFTVEPCVCTLCNGDQAILSKPAGVGYCDDLAEYIPCPNCSV